ncbi:ABC transporter permease [uncultured Enterovirga sp.]|uniref:ABC transporter permease n=1 Tax=uncultured Enterovirga sp. TaxID=2026352 RepID=UPI0035CBF1F8
MSKGDRLYAWLLAPALALMLVFYVYPVARVLWISVTDPAPGLGNYALLFTSASIQRMIVTTARISVLTTLITLVLAYIVAYVLIFSSESAKRMMLVGILIPLWISVLVRAFAWVALLRREGVVNNALMASGAIDQPLALIWNETGIMIGMVHYMLPLGILPLYSAMRDIDLRCIAAARGLGASPFQVFRRVFWPLSLPGVIGSGLLVFIFSLGFFVTPAILGGGRTLMAAEYINVQIHELVRWGIGTMVASTLVIVVVALVLLLGRLVDISRLFGSR